PILPAIESNMSRIAASELISDIGKSHYWHFYLCLEVGIRVAYNY
ncbi:MAG: hypothetical protein H6Q64_1894, partial [Firmicutes bacterium]|nr:hypothetical protein [Bacillota bacterium]